MFVVAFVIESLLNCVVLNLVLMAQLTFECLTDRTLLQPGVQGIGWWLNEANIAQISLNLTDMDLTPMHVAFEEVFDRVQFIVFDVW